MSKSAELDASRINLLDDPATIVKKVKGAKTDALEGLEWDNPERPEARNLLAIYQLATGMSMVCRPPRCPVLEECASRGPTTICMSLLSAIGNRLRLHDDGSSSVQQPKPAQLPWFCSTNSARAQDDECPVNERRRWW